MANIFVTEHAADNRETAMEATKVSLSYTQISRTLVYKRLKYDRRFTTLFRWLRNLMAHILYWNVVDNQKSVGNN